MNYQVVSKNESGKTLRAVLHNQTKKAHLYTANLKPWAHIHQPTAWPVPTACAQPYHPGSGSHGQLFRPYWGLSAWHSRRVCLIYTDIMKEQVNGLPLMKQVYRVFSITWPAPMQIYRNKRSVCIRKEFNSQRIGLGHKH